MSLCYYVKNLRGVSLFVCHHCSVLPGDYVLRDPAGGPRGMVRVMVKWKYPFQPPVGGQHSRQETGADEQSRVMESTEKDERRREDVSQRPIAKPRVKVL